MHMTRDKMDRMRGAVAQVVHKSDGPMVIKEIRQELIDLDFFADDPTPTEISDAVGGADALGMIEEAEDEDGWVSQDGSR